MTTIAYRNGVIAADSVMNQDGSAIYGRLKVARRKDGALIGAAGASGWCEAFRQWAHEENGPPPKIDVTAETGTGVIIMPDGTIRMWDTAEPEKSVTLRPPYYALGSGQDYALGAMFCGASAEEAVRAAVHHDKCTGGNITVLRHELPQE